MEIEDSIKNINNLFAKRMSIFYVNSEINKIENALKVIITRYVRDLEAHHKELFKYHQSKKMRIELYHYTYIACVIGAKFKKYGTIGTSHGYLNNYKIFSALKSKLIFLGRIGTRSPIKNKNGRANFIGKCAEIKCAYQLNNKTKISHIKDIEFTNPYRPRTQQIIERCNTCKFIFGNV